MPTRTATARLRGGDDPREADCRPDHPNVPAFLRPETNEPDARNDPLPEWTRPPADWREEHDVTAGRRQLLGLAPPGAPTAENPCALRLKLPGARAATTPVEPGTTHDDGAWIRRPHLFTPRGNGGWNVVVHNSSRRVGTLTDTGGQVEIRRTDPCSTLLAVVPQPGEQKLLEPPLLGRALGLAHLVFSVRWPPGPPAVRLPDEYRKPTKTAPGPQAPAARGSR